MAENTYRIPVFATLETAWNKMKGAKRSIWAAFLISMLILLLLNLILTPLVNITPPIQPVVIAILSVVFAIFFIILILAQTFLPLGLFYIGIRRAQDLPISYRLMFRAFESPIAIRLIGVYLLHFLLFGIPIIALIVAITMISQMFGVTQISPGTSILIAIGMVVLLCIFFYFIFRLMFSWAFVLDKATNSWDAIKSSYAITQSNFWRVIAIFLLGTLIMLGILIPAIACLIYAIVYKSMIMGFLYIVFLIIGLIWVLPFGYLLYGTTYNNLDTRKISAQ